MYENSSDARVPLEWIQHGKYWIFPMLEHNWIELRGLIGKVDLELTQINASNYHVERAPNGEHRILWVNPSENPPAQVYGLIAFRPKAPSTFLGIPLILLIPIVTALISVGGTISIQLLAGKKDQDLSICKNSNEWAPVATLNKCNSELSQLKIINDSAQSCIQKNKDFQKYILPKHTDERILYLIGASQGYRIEGITKLLEGSPAVKEIAIHTENEYVNSLLKNDSNAEAYAKGLSYGHEEGQRILDLGELQILNGQDHFYER